MANWRRKLLFWTAGLLGSLIVLAAGSQLASAAVPIFNDVCASGGTGNSAICNTGDGNNISGPNGILIKVANIFAFITGIAAVIIIIIGGFMYITAGGDANKASSARGAITYAVIGIVVVVAGRAIIGLVITKF